MKTWPVTLVRHESLRSWIPPQDNSAKAIVGYRIYRDDGNGGAIDSQLALTDENTFSYTDSGLVTGNVYYYRWGMGWTLMEIQGKSREKKEEKVWLTSIDLTGDFPIFQHFTSRFSMTFHLSYFKHANKTCQTPCWKPIIIFQDYDQLAIFIGKVCENGEWWLF